MPLVIAVVIGLVAGAVWGGAFDALVGELLDRHYDPMYGRSIRGNFPAIDAAICVTPAGIVAV